MTESKESEETAPPVENILRIADELVYQVNRTKRLVIVMIIAVIIGVPVSWHIAPILTGTPDSSLIARYVAILIGVVFLAVGIRQWLVLSKWTKKYKVYKELQRKVDQELDFEGGVPKGEGK